MSIFNVLGIWITMARVNINGNKFYFYRSAKSKEEAVKKMFKLIEITSKVPELIIHTPRKHNLTIS